MKCFRHARLRAAAALSLPLRPSLAVRGHVEIELAALARKLPDGNPDGELSPRLYGKPDPNRLCRV